MITLPLLFARLLAGARSRLRHFALFGLAAITPLWAAPGLVPAPWATQDIGSVGLAGSARYTGTTFTVNGAGADVYNTADAFRFVYQPFNGDCTIVARVVTEVPTPPATTIDPAAKAGVMIRESLAGNAAYSFISLAPSTGTNGVRFESRASTGASSALIGGATSLVAPYWLKLVRAGNTFTASRSPDGVTWTAVGTQTLSFTSSVLVGLAVCSHDVTKLNTSTFDNVSATNGLPTPWSTWDVGAPGAIGSAAYSSGTFTVTGAGAEVYGSSGDAFHFVYQNLTGDGTVTVRVATEQNTSQWAKVGVMLRESLTDNSAYSFLLITPNSGTNRGILFESRGTTGAGATQTANLPGYLAPYWLRLQRAGTTLTASISTDGLSWAVVRTQTLSLATTLYAGMAVCSHVAGTLNTSTFTDASVVPWVDTDVGGPSPDGGSNISGGTFTVKGAGTEVFYASDQFHYLSQTLTGDGTVTARVATEQNTNPWAKVGLMFRESTAADAAYSFVFITPNSGTNHGVAFESRASTGAGATQTINVGTYVAPYWLRLQRVGSTFTALISADGVTWTAIGSQTLTLAATLNVGLVVCSHLASTLNTSTFTDVSVSPWVDTDVGGPSPAGSSSISGGTFTVSGSGTEVYGTTDQFHYLSQSFTGDCTLTARVATEQNTGQWGKIGLMFRETRAANSAYSFLLLTPDQVSPAVDRGILFESRGSTGASSTQTATVVARPTLPTTPVAPYWLRLSRSGNLFTAYRSPDGVAWTIIGSQTLMMASTLNVGLVVCSHSAGVLNTSTFDNVSLTAGGTFKTVFPKLAGINFGAKNYEDPAYQDAIAKLDLVVYGFYKGWANSASGQTIRSVVQTVKAMHPSLLVANYTILESQYNPRTVGQADYDTYLKLTNETGPSNGGSWLPNDWWAHDLTGGMLYNGTYTTQKLVNMTTFTVASGGQRFPQWFAQRGYDAFFSASATPEFDIWFLDNIFYKPRKDADWNRDGILDSRDDPAVRTYYRQGNVDHIAAIQALKPGALVMGNIEHASGSTPQAGALRETQYAGLFAGAFQEATLGATWSEEDNYANGWDVMMSSYRSMMDNTIAPHLVLFAARGEEVSLGFINYASFRYAFASALMEDGYFAFTKQVGSDWPYYGVTWFDEYDLAGTSTTGWLGASVDAKQRTPKSNGVYIRRFQNGLAITNPKGNGTQTINLSTLFPGETYKRIVGTQDATTNNGATVTSLTINARDGLILKKQ